MISLDGISLKNKQTPTLNDKFIHLAQNCATLKKLFDKLVKRHILVR